MKSIITGMQAIISKYIQQPTRVYFHEFEVYRNPTGTLSVKVWTSIRNLPIANFMYFDDPKDNIELVFRKKVVYR